MKKRFVAVMNGSIYLVWLGVEDHLFTLALRRIPAENPASPSGGEEEGEIAAMVEEDYLGRHRSLHIKDGHAQADIIIYPGEGGALEKAVEEAFNHTVNALLDFVADTLENARTIVVSEE